jgi:diguanylate cyclase (GGDEF)-like protein
LVVDDCPDNLSLVASLLIRQGCEVFVADSGPRALELVEQIAPALILLDLMMPDMDGIETCERLKALPRVRHVPVVILTAYDDDQSLLRSFAAGAVDYVLKPFNPAVLLARVTTQVELYLRTMELERLAGIDALTGLPNRRAFDQCLGDEWRRSRRSGAGLGLLLLDIDWFKQYNDGNGHQQGDIALRAVANAIQQSIRRGIDFCGRYGGEEFVVLSVCDQGGNPERLAQRILDAVRGLSISHGYGCAGPIVTVSAGYACVVPQRVLSPVALFEAADTALYRAKEQGRDRAERGLVSAVV